MELFFGVLFISFMFIGIVFSVYAVVYLLLRPRERCETVLFPLYENDGDIRRILGYISYKYTFCPAGVKIVLVDMGLNNIQKEVCRQFCAENPSVKLITSEKITEVL